MNLTFLKRLKGLCILPVLLFSGIGFLVMGYHPGAEDNEVYLPAIKADLNTSLFPHDAVFFQLQMRTSVFPHLMAHSVAMTGMPLEWAELLWQLASIFMILWACWSVVCQLFEEAEARWAGLAMVAAMFTLPVAGTGLYIVDQYLHPRAMATALILFGVSRILSGKGWQSVPLLVLGTVLHPLMGALGISFCCILALTLFEPLQTRLRALRVGPVSNSSATVAAFLPLGSVFHPPSQIWLEIARNRHLLRLYQWEWYEWLGAIAPLLLFALVAYVAHRRRETKLARFATAICVYGVFQMAVAMIVLGPKSLIGLSALEPMRFLHLIYVLLMLVGGAYLGRHVLQRKAWRWAVLLILANGGMFIAQRQLFAGTEHLELPERSSANPWLQAFTWIRQNTPGDAYFALDPNYLAAPGEDYHGFRALAERSQLADNIKDRSMVTLVPELCEEWDRQVKAQQGWAHFQLTDFERLKAQFGVNWVVVSYPPPGGLACRWHNDAVSVCQVP